MKISKRNGWTKEGNVWRKGTVLVSRGPNGKWYWRDNATGLSGIANTRSDVEGMVCK